VVVQARAEARVVVEMAEAAEEAKVAEMAVEEVVGVETEEEARGKAGVGTVAGVDNACEVCVHVGHDDVGYDHDEKT
jgi:hypothetical protein